MEGASVGILQLGIDNGFDGNQNIEVARMSPTARAVCQGCQQKFLETPEGVAWEQLDAVLGNAPGLTPLMCASIFGSLRAVELLLKARAEVGIQNDIGQTA